MRWIGIEGDRAQAQGPRPPCKFHRGENGLLCWLLLLVKEYSAKALAGSGNEIMETWTRGLGEEPDCIGINKGVEGTKVSGDI